MFTFIFIVGMLFSPALQKFFVNWYYYFGRRFDAELLIRLFVFGCFFTIYDFDGCVMGVGNLLGVSLSPVIGGLVEMNLDAIPFTSPNKKVLVMSALCILAGAVGYFIMKHYIKKCLGESRVNVKGHPFLSWGEEYDDSEIKTKVNIYALILVAVLICQCAMVFLLI